MSKMSEVAMELDDQAMELGFESYEEALAKGYEWCVDKDGNAVLYNPNEEQEQAHVAYIVEREQHLATLTKMAELLRASDLPNIASEIEDAVNFFKKGEC